MKTLQTETSFYDGHTSSGQIAGKAPQATAVAGSITYSLSKFDYDGDVGGLQVGEYKEIEACFLITSSDTISPALNIAGTTAISLPKINTLSKYCHYRVRITYIGSSTFRVTMFKSENDSTTEDVSFSDKLGADFTTISSADPLSVSITHTGIVTTGAIGWVNVGGVV